MVWVVGSFRTWVYRRSFISSVNVLIDICLNMWGFFYLFYFPDVHWKLEVDMMPTFGATSDNNQTFWQAVVFNVRIMVVHIINGTIFTNDVSFYGQRVRLWNKGICRMHLNCIPNQMVGLVKTWVSMAVHPCPRWHKGVLLMVWCRQAISHYLLNQISVVLWCH